MPLFVTPDSGSTGGDVLSVAGRTGNVVLVQADIAGLVTDLAGKAASSHTHAQADVSGLVTALAGKAAASHTHAQADVSGLVTALAGKEPTIAAGTSGQWFRHDKTWASLGISNITGLQTALDGKAASSHYHDIAYINGLETALSSKASTDDLSSKADTSYVDSAVSGKASTDDLNTVSGDLSSHVGNSSIHLSIADGTTAGDSVWSSSKISTELAGKMALTGGAIAAAVSLYLAVGFTPSNAALEIVASDGSTRVAKILGNGNLVATNHVEVAGFEDVPASGNVQAGIKVYARPVMTSGPIVGWRMRAANSGNCAVKVSKIAANGTTVTELFTATMTAAQVASGAVSHAIGEDEWIQCEVTGTPTVTGVTFGLVQRRGA